MTKEETRDEARRWLMISARAERVGIFGLIWILIRLAFSRNKPIRVI